MNNASPTIDTPAAPRLFTFEEVQRLLAASREPMFRMEAQEQPRPQATPKASPSPLDAMLDVAQAAAYLHVAQQTIRNWTYRGKLSVQKVGRNVYYMTEDLDKMVRRVEIVS